MWLYPVGWADVGYSPAEVAIKEVYEETGIEVEVLSLVAVFDGLRLGFARLPMYSIAFHCRVLGGELRGHPLETRQVGFFSREELPWPLAGGARWVDTAFAAINGEVRPVDFDAPRTPPWRGDPRLDRSGASAPGRSGPARYSEEPRREGLYRPALSSTS